MSVAVICAMAFSEDSRTLTCVGSEATTLVLLDKAANQWQVISSPVSSAPDFIPYVDESWMKSLSIHGSPWDYEIREGKAWFKPTLKVFEGSGTAGQIPTPTWDNPFGYTTATLTMESSNSISVAASVNRVLAKLGARTPDGQTQPEQERLLESIISLDSAEGTGMMAWSRHVGKKYESILLDADGKESSLEDISGMYPAYNLAFSSDGRYLACGGIGARLIDTKRKTSVWMYYSELTHGIVRVTSLAISPDDTMLAVAMTPGTDPSLNPQTAPAIFVFDISAWTKSKDGEVKEDATAPLLVRHNLEFVSLAALAERMRLDGRMDELQKEVEREAE